MKIDARRIDSILRSPDGFDLILLYGEDSGLIRARGDQLTRAVAGSLDDPFRVAALERETHDRVLEEATALAMTGGRRVVRVRDASDTLLPSVEALLGEAGDCLTILEAPGLPSRSKLRALAERHDKAASIACYPEEGRGLEATIRAVLAEARVGVDREALAWLVSQLGADQAMTRHEVEKLALYCGPDTTATLADAQACVGDATTISLDDALYAATRGDVAATDRALTLARAEGLAAVGLLRAALGHLQKLHKAAVSVAGGQAPADAMRAVRPPIFFRRQQDFVRALELWRPDHVAAAQAAMSTAELSCKRTGAPDEAISSHALLVVAGRAAQLRRATRA